MTPDQAFDILLDSALFSEWLSDQEVSFAEGHSRLTKIAMAVIESDEPIDPPALRAARAAHAGRDLGTGARTDIESLCAFVETAGRLPPRLIDVFTLCILHGKTHRECAERLNIQPSTVRVHLRRLRRIMRRAGDLPNDPRVI